MKKEIIVFFATSAIALIGCSEEGTPATDSDSTDANSAVRSGGPDFYYLNLLTDRVA